MEFEHRHGRITLELASERETDTLGAAIASAIKSGQVIGLIGGLGAGKTRLCRAIAEALGVDPAAIASPTYVLIHEYDGTMPISHFDAYRLDGPDAFDAIGAAEYFEAGGLCLVEWADLVLDRLPPDSWLIHLATTGIESRSIAIEGQRLDALALAIERA